MPKHPPVMKAAASSQYGSKCADAADFLELQLREYVPKSLYALSLASRIRREHLGNYRTYLWGQLEPLALGLWLHLAAAGSLGSGAPNTEV